MKANLFTLVLFFGGVFSLLAQAPSKAVLLTIDGQPVYKNEFEQLFTKNKAMVQGQEQAEQTVADYLPLFIDYKLKVLEAQAEGLDTLKSFTGEYAIYKSQLANKYMRQTPVSQALLKEAYQRMQYEVNASHILVALAPGALPKDTLVAYHKIMDARRQIVNGKSFEKVARAISADPSVKQNGGNLGWFGVFKMVYPFESAAYKTKVGEISYPFRTRFGYHILKVNAKRKAQGSVKVAMIRIDGQGKSTGPAKTKIETIYRKLKQGAKFSDLAKQFSDDKKSAVNGGELPVFSRGESNAEKFEQVAFSLKKADQYSHPFETKGAWYILQLKKRLPVKSFEEEKPALKRILKGDQRAQIINEDLFAKLQKKYDVQRGPHVLQFFQQKISDVVLQGVWKVDSFKKIPKKVALSIGKAQKTYADFARYIEENQSRNRTGKSKSELLAGLFHKFEEQFLFGYYKKHLAETNPAYAAIIQEYHDGLLIFALMQKKIWNNAQSDSVSLENYYQEHPEKYQSSKRYKAIIFSSDAKKTAKKVRKALRKQEGPKAILKENPTVVSRSGTFENGNVSLPKNFKGKVGVSKIYKNNGLFLVTKVLEIIPSQRQSFQDAKSRVINDYQQELEAQWVQKLREKYKVNVNQAVLKKLRKQLE